VQISRHGSAEAGVAAAETAAANGGERHPIKWTAPEAQGHYRTHTNKQTDVFAFGVTM
jgi:hypothetical protein